MSRTILRIHDTEKRWISKISQSCEMSERDERLGRKSRRVIDRALKHELIVKSRQKNIEETRVDSDYISLTISQK